MTAHQTCVGAVQLAGMLAGFIVGPVATPALIWLALALDLPLVVIIALLIVMALVSKGLSHIIIQVCKLSEASAAAARLMDVAASRSRKTCQPRSPLRPAARSTERTNAHMFR